MMSSWTEVDTLDFLERALSYVIGEEGKYPVIQYGGIGPSDKQSALACADKMRAINRLLDSYAF